MKIKSMNLRIKLLLINMFLIIFLIILFTMTFIDIAKKNIDKVSEKVELEIENTLTQKLEKATEIAENILEKEQDILQRDAVFLINNQKAKNILNYGLVEKKQLQKFDNKYIQEYKKATGIDYLRLIIELKKNMFGLEDSLENVQIVDKNGIVMASTIGLSKEYQEKNKSKMIKYMFETKAESLATILSTENGLTLKAYGSYLNEFISPIGLIIINQLIEVNFANKLKNLTDTEIAIYNKHKNVTSTFFKFDDNIKILNLEEEKEVFNKLKDGNSSIVKDKIVYFGEINGKKIKKKYRFVFRPIINYKNEVIGMIAAALSKEKNYSLIDKFEKTKEKIYMELKEKVIGLSFLILIFAIIIINVYSKMIVAPLQEVLKIVKEVSKGKLENKVEIKSNDELAKLGEGINNMIEGLKEMETLKKNQNEMVQSKKMASLGELVAGVAHEINTPLGIEITSITYMEDRLGKFKEKYENSQMTKKDLEIFLAELEEGIKLINSNLEKTVNLVGNFKKIAVIQKIDKKNKFNIKELIETIALILNIKKKNYEFKINCSEDIEINSYSSAFLEILLQLIKNSEIHGFIGEKDEKIEIEIQKEEKNIIMIYKENGKGIDKEIIEKIYEPFFTTKRGNKSQSGLGFHIIYNLIKHKLKGEIEIKSEKGKGIIVLIKIPL
ncbi:MAG: hypothetical protein B6I28_03865 [Fusobacteriia bacterium 4572_132]|nr:MAG: hypothetical protein B6I28_03865 [Fusobacteriia bacterium 4572_132]